jgi:cobaltochelatase CobT
MLDYSNRLTTAVAWSRTYANRGITTPVPAVLHHLDCSTRNGSDAVAAWLRWHDTTQDRYFSRQAWAWYVVLEQARVEALASHHLPGIRSNLDSADTITASQAQAGALYRTARAIFSNDQSVAIQLSSVSMALADVIGKTLHDARAALSDGARFAASVLPLIQRLMVEIDSSASAEMAALALALPLCAASPLHDANVLGDGDDAEDSTDGIEPELLERDYPGYRVYSSRWDETLLAAHYYRSDDAAALQFLGERCTRRSRQLARRLQRELVVAHLRRWSFDEEDGSLDGRRLARLIAPGGRIDVFRKESEKPIPEACVLLLVDQSGSMQGERQRMAVLAIDLAVHTLEICGIRCEVLGYTTRYRADNPLCRSWQDAGAPSAPGRLNAVRHIVYKTASQPWRRCRHTLGLMLRAGFGKENIDGEALDWAARRLAARPEPHKILVVLSDGAPCDESTQHANGHAFLDAHLRAVIKAVEASPVRLAAIGTGHHVGRYYRNALTLRGVDEVAEVLFGHLGVLLTRPNMSERAQ